MKTVVFFGHSPYRKMGLDVSGRCLPNHTRVSALSTNTLGYVSDARETLWHAFGTHLVFTSSVISRMWSGQEKKN